MKIAKVEIIEKKAQTSFPDIDVDFGDNPINGFGKKTIIEYLKNKYGKDHVAQVGNRNMYSAKSAIIDLGTVFDISSDKIFEISKVYNDDFTVEENCKRNPIIKNFFSGKDLEKLPDDIKEQEIEKRKEMKKLLPKFEGIIRSYSIHAGGVVITDKKYPIVRYSALQRTAEDGMIATLWTKDEIEEIGLVKYDILGIEAASQIHTVRTLIGNDPYVDEPEDPEVFKYIVGNVLHRNIFQFESELGAVAFRELKPMSINELSAASALIRITSNEEGRKFYKKYIDNSNAAHKGNEDFWKKKLREEVVNSENAAICEDVLSNTYGVLIFQEQIAFLVQKLSRGKKSFTDGNKVRKLLEKLSKKHGNIDSLQGNKDGLIAWHKDFMDIIGPTIVDHIMEDGPDSKDEIIQNFINCVLTEDNHLVIPSKGIINWLIVSSLYTFSAIHSTAYAINGYAQMWQKYYYPKEFWYAALQTGTKKNINEYISAIRSEKANVIIYPPDINLSDADWKMEKDGIRFGLSNIRGCDKIGLLILEERKKGLFKNVEDFINRLPKINKTGLENLLSANAFVSFGEQEKIYKIIKSKKEINDFLFTQDEMSKRENKVLETNISYISEMTKIAKNYTSMGNLSPHNVLTSVIVKLEKAKSKKSKKTNKEYYELNVQCLNDFNYYKVFCWDMEKGSELEKKKGESMLLEVRKNKDFISLNIFYKK